MTALQFWSLIAAIYTAPDVPSRYRRVFAFVFIVCALLASTAHADELWLTSGFLSKHDKAGRNENNDGAGLELGLGEGWAVAAGQYRNSMNRDSRYAAAVWQPWAPVAHVRLGGVVGVVSGYGQALTPLLLPALSVNTRYLGFNLLAIPSVGRVRSASVALQIKVRLF